MTEPTATHGSEEDRYHVVASPSLTSDGTHVLKNGDCFALLNQFGDIQSPKLGEQGIYHDGTRYVSHLKLMIGKHRPLLLSSSVAQDNQTLLVELTNSELTSPEHHVSIPYGTLHLQRSKLLRGKTYLERLLLSNYGSEAIQFELRLEFGGDFVDIFEVRGTRRAKRGELAAPELNEGVVSMTYLGLDGLTRRTRVEFVPRPTRLEVGLAVFEVRLESRQSREIYLWIECQAFATQTEPAPFVLVPFDSARARSTAELLEKESDECEIYTSNEQFNDWINRARSDLRMLTTETPQGPYPYAGVPWFSTPFGRDGLWTALQTLWLRPDLAKGVLRFLSAHQATEHQPESDAQPGKILHEMRGGEMAALREIPFGHYYGSVDSTPLYLILAAQYFEATGDRELLDQLWPNLLAAARWLETYGDIDGDGFLEYGRTSADGLVQQGWKDSNDSVFHRDGSLALGPIALAEVQGYAYAAYEGMARIANQIGETNASVRWQQQAEALKREFDVAFWCNEISTYALALDRAKLPCRVRSSNAGHCLYSGIVLPSRAGVLCDQLVSPEMFSGWGIRTLANSEQRYNPISYHNGSIWPHDNAIIAAGFAAYGRKDAAASVLTALFDATLFTPLHRLPELFCGFARQPGQGPTRYPVACSPQAWASGAVFMLLQSIIGLEVQAQERRVLLRHAFLPPFLEEVRIRNLRVGDARIDLRLLRHADDVGVSVMRKRGKVDVVAVL